MREGWKIKKLGEVCDFQGGSQPPKDEWISEPREGYVRILQIRDFTQKRSSDIEFVKKSNRLKYCQETDILLGRYGASVGKVLTGLAGAYNVAIIKTMPDETLIDRSFFKYFLLSPHFQDFLQHASKMRAAQAGFSKEDIQDYLVFVPPLSEQKRIVAELDLLSEVIAKKREQLTQLDALAQSLFYTMFGDPITNEKEWETKRLGEISTSQIGITYKPEDVSNNEKGTVVLRSGNIQNSTLCFKDIVRVNSDIRENKYVRTGDILMCSRNGSSQLVGKVAMIPNLKEKMTYGAFMTVIRSDFQPFLFAFFRSPAFRSQLTTAKTATINQITVKMLENMQVILPPLALQQQFAEKIEAIEQQKERIRQSLAEVQLLFDSRMDYYFNEWAE